MYKTIAGILVGVFILSIMGEVIYSTTHSMTWMAGEYKWLYYTVSIRWEVVMSHVCVAGLTVMACLRFFDKLCRLN